MLDLPRQSQHAVLTQRIGITDITLNYHRPLANGRQIWLCWRLGEGDIAFWHELSDGFGGRRPLADLT